MLMKLPFQQEYPYFLDATALLIPALVAFLRLGALDFEQSTVETQLRQFSGVVFKISLMKSSISCPFYLQKQVRTTL